MAVQTRRPGPQTRLPQPGAPIDRGREIRLGVLGVLGIAVLVIGVPAALVAFVGYPLPRSAPSKDWLTQTVTATLLIKVLACVLWVVWAHFVVCLLSEWRALRHGRLPSDVPLGGGSQLLARRLVAAALLLTGAATAFPHHAGGSSAVPRPPVAAHQTVTATATTAAAHAGSSTHESVATSAAERTAVEKATKYYVVEPPHGRRYDSLWDIAERTLKDPLRYKEIFALNKDRVQADGGSLVDANLIRPGWHLLLPADASGPGVHVVQAQAPAHAADSVHPGGADDAHAGSGAVGSGVGAEAAGGAGGAVGGGSGGLSGGGGGGGGLHAGNTAPVLAPAVAAPGGAVATGSGGHLALGGALMLAGVLAALGARRGPYAPAGAVEEGLALAADPGLAAALDRALRSLATARVAQGRALPQPVVAWVSPDQVTLNLVAGDVDEPPTPWRATDDGRSWTVRLADLTDAPVDGPAPFPGLLSVGRHEPFELFVDLEQAPGVVAVGGDLDIARDVVAAWAVQAVTSLWSDGAQVTLVGFADAEQLAAVDPRRIDHAPTLSAVLDRVEQRSDDVRRVLRQLGVDGVITGRLARRDDLWQPQVLVLSGPPTPDEARRLQLLVGAGRSSVLALCVGDAASARWRFSVDGAGTLDLGVLGTTAQAHRLPRTAVADLVTLAHAADRARREQSHAVSELTPRAAVAAADSSAPRRVAGSGRLPVVAALSLLGPVAVEAPGPLDPARRELATEIVAAVALHPDGLHDAVLRASIWPRGASDEVVAAALADVSAWLGTDATGAPCLTERDGRWVLSSAVRVDWDDFRASAEAAGPDEAGELRRGVELLRGPVFSGTPAGRYQWLAFGRAARECRLVVTAVVRRAAALWVAQGRADEAEQILRRGLAAVPTAEPVWRDLLELVSRRGPDDTAAVADELYDVLSRHGSWAEPETDALVAQLAPGRLRADRTA